jgi:hypothetical protein
VSHSQPSKMIFASTTSSHASYALKIGMGGLKNRL